MLSAEQIIARLEESAKEANRLADMWRDEEDKSFRNQDYIGAQYARSAVMGYQHESLTLELIMGEILHG